METVDLFAGHGVPSDSGHRDTKVVLRRMFLSGVTWPPHGICRRAGGLFHCYRQLGCDTLDRTADGTARTRNIVRGTRVRSGRVQTYSSHATRCESVGYAKGGWLQSGKVISIIKKKNTRPHARMHVNMLGCARTQITGHVARGCFNVVARGAQRAAGQSGYEFADVDNAVTRVYYPYFCTVPGLSVKIKMALIIASTTTIIVGSGEKKR